MHKNFKKILLVSSEFPPNVGGIGNHAYNLAKALQSEGFEVEVVADIIDVDKKEQENFASKQAFKIHWIVRKKPIAQTYFARIAKAVAVAKRSEKVICSGKFSLWIAILIRLRFPRKELIAIAHGTELDLRSGASKKATSLGLQKVNKIISVSNYTQQFLPKHLPNSIKKFIIHNGIDNKEFDIESPGPLEGTPALITIGNVTERKGQQNVISALPFILTENPLVRYHIVGKPTIKDQVEKRAKELKVADRAQFYGAIKRNELLQKLSGATIKLMLSNHTAEGDFEGFGIAVLEANAFGVPSIGSKDSGIADAIVDGETGLLVDQHNPQEVAAAVKTIMKDYTRFSSNAKEWARQHDWKIIVKKYVDALNA